MTNNILFNRSTRVIEDKINRNKGYLKHVTDKLERERVEGRIAGLSDALHQIINEVKNI